MANPNPSPATRFTSTNQPKNKGRKKGSRNFSTSFRKLMTNEKFAKSIIGKTPEQWEGIVDNIPTDVIAAVVVAKIQQAAVTEMVENPGVPPSKELRESILLLNKLGYGEKVVIEPEESVFERVNLNFNVVQSARTEDELDGLSEQ